MTAHAPLVADWLSDPRTVRILASFTKHPPRAEWKVQTYAITRDEWPEYVGYRVDCLKHIRNAYAERLVHDTDALIAFVRGPDVQAVVGAALDDPFSTLNRSGLSMLAEMPEAA